MMPVTRATVVLVGMTTSLLACKDMLREGAYTCSGSGAATDCPPGWYCRAGSGGPERRCYSTRGVDRPDGGTDAGPSRPAPSVFPAWPLPGTPGHPFDYDVRELTVVDRVTGLEWERAVSVPSYTQAEALGYCESLELDGKSDWKLPTRIELLSIVDYAQFDPSVDPSAFPSTPLEDFCSSSAVAGSAGSAWGVHFYSGHTGDYDVSETFRVRCVR